MKPGLLSYDDALAALLAQATATDGCERVATIDACGRVLAEDIRSTIDVPRMDNAQMDGFAVRSADLAGASSEAPARLPVAQRIAAGRPGKPLAKGTAARIFTGASLPDGADAVVMQEDTCLAGDDVQIAERPEPGAWIRRAGEDIRVDSVVLWAGTRLTPQAVGLAASVGLAELPVRKPLRVACFFTGDELALPGDSLAPGAIYNSNRYVLVALLRGLGCEVTDLGNVPDSLSATRKALRNAAADSDLIVTSGGMSVGEEDHVRPALQAEGELTLWQIAVKPGKPLAYGKVRRTAQAASGADLPRGSDRGGGGAGHDTGNAGGHAGSAQHGKGGGARSAHFIGLPGNPVSAFVTFLLFVRPFLLRLQGVENVAPQVLPLAAGFEWPNPDRRREFLRARIGADGMLELFPNQGSAVLTSTVWADGLVDNPSGQVIGFGDTVRFLPFAALLA